jgi:hypothetical protein
MNPNELFNKLANYLITHPDLMRHLDIGACWEYIITEKSTHEENQIVHFYLVKNEIDTLGLELQNPEVVPDLILYFTEKAILNLIDNNPNTDEYYLRYRKIMKNPQKDIEVDNKINKPRLKLLKMGYRNWQKDFQFN